ncbi:uncharacterized protein LOC127834528 [Dreissena polymorpha]|uniref:Uncharacterized protein n=1 Tax=Dreissena polymorpha TaxID=45954 RepID=A0A9D4GAT8_DREPO|nr:uncharacterized protein LOC127834528 [Dreissena polymorpha]KAH3813417.1 hypothetical protein DPMN_141873 [Dreissena polymorpha]
MANSGYIQRSILFFVLGLLTGILGLHPINESSRNASSNQCAQICPGAQSCVLSTLDGRFFFRCVQLDGQEQIIPYKEPDVNDLVETGPFVQTFLLPEGQADFMTAQDVIRGIMQPQIPMESTEIFQPNVIDQPQEVAQQNQVVLSQDILPPSLIRKANIQEQTIPLPSVILRETGQQQITETSQETMPGQSIVPSTPEVRQRPTGASRIGHSLRKALHTFKTRSRNGNVPSGQSRDQIRVTFRPAVPITAPPTFKVPSGNSQCEYCDSAVHCKDETRPYCFHSHACARRVCQSL